MVAIKPPAVTQLTTLSPVAKSPKWSIRGRNEVRTADREVPGPGAYTQEDSGVTSKFHTGPKFNFGTSTRGGPESAGGAAPGPGAYTLQTTVGVEGSSYSCTPRRDIPGSRKDVPGPGTHSLPHLTGGTGTPHYGFGTAERGEIGAAASPGPAAYDPSGKHGMGPKWGMGTAQRGNDGLSKDTPGPGAYTLPSRTVDGPKYSAAPRREDVTRTEGPGPSAYTLRNSIGDGAKFSIRARPSGRTSTQDDPGPGAYDSSRSMGVTKRKGANWVFGTSTRDGGTGYTAPGPGAYTPRNPVAEACPKYGFGSAQRGSMGSDKTTPGPGTYDLSYGDRPGPKHSLSFKQKDAAAKMNAPGPGAYDPKDGGPGARHKNQPQWGFGTANRQQNESSSQKAPGPGTYAHGSTLIGPKFSIQSRRALKERVKTTPGPGAHGGMVTQFGY